MRKYYKKSLLFYWNTRINGGFTVIELLVVISILGLLSSIVLVSIRSVKIKVNNEFTVQQFNQYKNVLRQYYFENREFPNTGVGDINIYCVGADPCWANSSDQNAAVNVILLEHMNTLPNINQRPLSIGFPPPFFWSGLGYQCSESFHVTCTILTLTWVLEGYPVDCEFHPQAITSERYDYAGNTYCLMTVTNGNL